MKTNKLMLACIWAALYGVSAPSFAHSSSHGNQEKPFSQSDSNNDGQVTPDEILAARQAKFNSINTTTDEPVTPPPRKTQGSRWLSSRAGWMRRNPLDSPLWIPIAVARCPRKSSSPR